MTLIQKFNLTSEECRLIGTNFSRLELVHQISPQTIPALAPGAEVKGIYVLKVSLKVRNYDERAANLILRLIHQKVVLYLSFGEEARLVVLHDKLLSSPWRLETTWNDAHLINLEGSDLDAVWLNFIRQISGVILDQDYELTKETLSNALRAHELNEKQKKEIERLEKTLHTEKQPRQKFKLHQEINKLKRQLSID